MIYYVNEYQRKLNYSQYAIEENEVFIRMIRGVFSIVFVCDVVPVT